MLIDTAPGMPYRFQECSHPWSTLHQYLPPTHSLYYSLWERTTFRQPSFTTDPFPLTQRESYMEQQHSPLERIVRLPSVLPLHALFSLAMMIHTETFYWVIFHAFSYKKKGEIRYLRKVFWSTSPQLNAFFDYAASYLCCKVTRGCHEPSKLPVFDYIHLLLEMALQNADALESPQSKNQNIHTIFSKPQNPLCCHPSYWDSSQGWL